MFEGFDLRYIDTGEVTLRVRVGGSGPGLLLQHGHPRTHVTWHRVAPLLARHFTVVCPDLRGYGDSSKPATLPDHAQASKRAMAGDIVNVMGQLGFDRFSLAGHDRGGYAAFRAAMDFPERVRRLAVLEVVPILDHLEPLRPDFALGWWHWFFFAQPADLPERLIGADPDYFYWKRRGDELPKGSTPEVFADYRRCFNNPDTIHAMLEDYRAGLGIDLEHERADRAAGRRLRCPVLALWAGRDDLADYVDVLEVWRRWADQVIGRAVDCGHHMQEEAPEEVVEELEKFFNF